MPFRYDESVKFDGHGTPEHDAWEERRAAGSAALHARMDVANKEARRGLLEALPSLPEPKIKLGVSVSRRGKGLRAEMLQLSEQVKLEFRFSPGKVRFLLEYFVYQGGGSPNIDYKCSAEFEFSADPGALVSDDSDRLSQLAKDWLMSDDLIAKITN